MGVEREEPSKGALIKFFCVCREVREHGNYHLGENGVNLDKIFLFAIFLVVFTFS